jgi:hypothetical protein
MLAGSAAAIGTKAGVIVNKVQRALTRERESYRFGLLQQRVTDALADEVAFSEAVTAWISGADLSPAAALVEQAIAARCADGFSGQFLQALPSKGKRVRPEQWRVMFARRWGVECPECSPHHNVRCGNTNVVIDVDPITGERTQRPGSGLPIRIGRYGCGLMLGSRKNKAGYVTTRHDTGGKEVFNTLVKAGVAARWEPKDHWINLIADTDAWAAAGPKARAGPIPDIEEDRGGGDIHLLDAKFWSLCATWFKHTYFLRGHSIARKRQESGAREMRYRFRKADRLFNPNMPRNARGQGPIEAAAAAYGRVQIVGCGPFGDTTPDTRELVNRAAAAAAAAGWRAMGAKSSVEAKAVLVFRGRQALGVAFARGTADLTLRRLRFELHRSRAPGTSGPARRDAAERTAADASDAYDAFSRMPG